MESARGRAGAGDPLSGTRREDSRLTLSTLAKPGRFAVALRVPAWAGQGAKVSVNGQPFAPTFSGGYALVERAWKAGDVVAISLPLDLRLESAPGDESTVAVLRGPMVLAADLGPVSDPWQGVDPAMVGENLLDRFQPVAAEEGDLCRARDHAADGPDLRAVLQPVRAAQRRLASAASPRPPGRPRRPRSSGRAGAL
ncbi:hypothetical protein ACRAWD_09730 [Caulobacter segnis]